MGRKRQRTRERMRERGERKKIVKQMPGEKKTFRCNCAGIKTHVFGHVFRIGN